MSRSCATAYLMRRTATVGVGLSEFHASTIALTLVVGSRVKKSIQLVIKFVSAIHKNFRNEKGELRGFHFDPICGDLQHAGQTNTKTSLAVVVVAVAVLVVVIIIVVVAAAVSIWHFKLRRYSV